MSIPTNPTFDIPMSKVKHLQEMKIFNNIYTHLICLKCIFKFKDKF
jgi:hypothetical protein